MNDKVFIHAPQDSGVPASARDFSVRDRVVVITGAGQGIGREYARQFAAAGAIPVIVDINEANCDSVLKLIQDLKESLVMTEAMLNELIDRHRLPGMLRVP